MDLNLYNRNFLEFLHRSPTPFHAVRNSIEILEKNEFKRLKEDAIWDLSDHGGYYIVRENGALIAFILGSSELKTDGFRIIGAHTDSPCLQIKPKAGVKTGDLMQLGVEVYGGNLLAPWFDRDLSLAGRVCCEDKNGKLTVVLIDFQRPLLFIPSIAIHFDREANKNRSINQQKDLPPILSQIVVDKCPDFLDIIKEQCKKQYPDQDFTKVQGFDIFCYDTVAPTITGLNNEFISGARLDNLVSCFAGISAVVSADKSKNCLVYLANHEENGSLSATGAQGSFMEAVLERIYAGPEDRRCGLSSSFLISMDNAHASHPNFHEKMDPSHEIRLNRGPVIKYNTNQRYTTFSLSSAVYKKVCSDANVPFQEFVMRSDLACGSTIGPMTAARLGLTSVDVGIPSLAMHSIREHTGISDPFDLYRSAISFFTSDAHRQISGM